MNVYELFIGLILVAVCFVFTGIGIAQYIIQSIALYKLAKKRNISNPWLAWIPFARTWVFGSVVDDFESEKDSKRKFRVILLVLEAVTFAVSIGMTAITNVLTASSIGYNEVLSNAEIVIYVIALYASLIPVLLLSITYSAIYLICLYKIHEYIYPAKALKYTVVSMLVPLGIAICFFKNAKRCPEKPCFKTPAPVIEQ